MTATRRTAIALLALAMMATGADTARSYVVYGYVWRSNIVMHLQLRGETGTLIDGAGSWNQSAEWALASWNPYVDKVQFRVVRESSAKTGGDNGVNNVFWSSSIYGRDFGTALAYTSYWYRGGQMLEGDVIFNTSSKYKWNSYRGDLRNSSSGGTLYDFRRVAAHEFGHVLGLTHPDEHGQDVVSIMHSHPTNLDHQAADDITGAQALYSIAGNGTVTFPPRNESLDFRSQLEAKYRDSLGRSPITTYVDNEGDIVWTSEYFRYRVNQCSHSAAITKVMNQIDGNGILGVCGSAPSGQVNFPPRNEALDFRTRLESKYRYELGRGPNSTRVDNEGDVVWTQEYLRYRVNRCAHGDAVQRVFLQIDGYGIQPVCR